MVPALSTVTAGSPCDFCGSLGVVMPNSRPRATVGSEAVVAPGTSTTEAVPR